MALERTHVLKTALTLLDEVGLDGLTLRRLATELGVQAPALYWHFKNKQELLDQMAEQVSKDEAPVRPPDGEPWDVWLADRARQMRRVLNAHRDGAMLAASTHPQPSQWGDIEMQIGVLEGVGFTPGEALRALIAIGNYVSGFTLEEQADRLQGDIDPTEEQFAGMVAQLGENYPRIAAALTEVGDPQSDPAFEAGLQVIMDGLRHRVARRT